MIKEALDDYAKSIQRKFNHDRTVTVGASEIGQCERKIAWVKKGTNGSDAGGWGAQIRGSIMESQFWVLAMKKRYGKRLLYAGEDQQNFADGALSATPDGLITGAPRDMLRHLGVKDILADCILIECKTIDPRVNLRQAKEENTFQVQVQLGLVNALTPYKPQYAVISYMDASFWSEVAEFAVKYDPKVFAVAHSRAIRILESRPEDLKPEGWIAGGRECEYCPFTKPCGVTRRSVPEHEAAADKQFVAEVADMCRAYLDLQNEANQVDVKIKTKQQEIKDRLREKNVRRIPGVVTWSAVKGRVSYDDKAIREVAASKGIDVEKYSTVGEPTDRLQVSAMVAGK